MVTGPAAVAKVSQRLRRLQGRRFRAMRGDIYHVMPRGEGKGKLFQCGNVDWEWRLAENDDLIRTGNLR